jgi:hypothetical protein
MAAAQVLHVGRPPGPSNGEITLSSTSKASEMLSTDIPYNDKLPAKITTTVTKATVNFMPAIFAIVK